MPPCFFFALFALLFTRSHHFLGAGRHDALFLDDRHRPHGEAHFKIFAAEYEGQEQAEWREEKLVEQRFSCQRHLRHDEQARRNGGDGAASDERVGGRRLEEQADAAPDDGSAHEKHGECEDELDAGEEERHIVGRERP